MRRGQVRLAVLVALGLPVMARAADQIVLPSGQAVAWVETVRDAAGPMGLTLRFRFLAPQIGAAGNISAEEALEDMAYLCDSFVLPRLPDLGPQPAEVVISLSDRALDFGATDPEAVQYFEAFRIADGACELEYL
ncbi:DUF6497 family protein [Phaeovulum sp. NW3]|uniref:DUF6497 family protein n=1 Tax=Phaeovulum sp. NW3 TaxID=2934933 RepID=UPI00201FC9FD|nr:DUF6497 family protein [Phaeovulum sp. NW3]MCL7464992.1 DUF6497 family protein [Phaeovulum sp. NW3]